VVTRKRNDICRSPVIHYRYRRLDPQVRRLQLAEAVRALTRIGAS
jgi:hypothetical protein